MYRPPYPPLNPRQLCILKALEDLDGNSTSKKIAEHLGISANGVAQTLAFLEKRGHVQSIEAGTWLSAKRWRLVKIS